MTEKLSLEQFGAALLRTQDLDPVYVAIHNANLSLDMRARLLLGYACCYHLGAAAYMAEAAPGRYYWGLLEDMARNVTAPKIRPGERWPRAAERRHFRGKQAIDAVMLLQVLYTQPEDALYGMIGDDTPHTFQQVSEQVRSHRGFGPWIAFKLADLRERVFGWPTDFSDCHLDIYKDPVQGAALHRFGDWKHPITGWEVRETYDELVKLFRRKKSKAPPTGDRLVNIQEVETICCKFKSYWKGHYYVGKDIAEVGHGLEGWGDLAQQLKKGLPPHVTQKA